MAGATVAATTVASLPALPATHPDAALLRVVREFDAAKAAWVQADEHEEALGAKARKEYPERPLQLHRRIFTPEALNELRPMSREEIVALYTQPCHLGPRTAKETLERRLKIFDTYDTERQAVDVRLGVPEAGARTKTFLTEYAEAEERVYQTPAKTAEGIAAKLRVAIQEYATSLPNRFR